MTTGTTWRRRSSSNYGDLSASSTSATGFPPGCTASPSTSAISFYRRENTRTRYVISDEEHLLGAIDEAKDQPEEIRLLYEFIEGLDPLNKALVLLYLDGNNYQEIAEVLGITETNVATKISRLKSKMKQEFRETGQIESQAKSRTET